MEVRRLSNPYSKMGGDKTKQDGEENGVGGLFALAKSLCPHLCSITKTNPALGQVGFLWTLEMGNAKALRRWVRRQRRLREHWLLAN